jgi:O-antigen/teichoic acid export membrane protein
VSSVRRSLLAQLASSYFGLVLQVASAAIIARLLTPVEIGVFSVAAVLMAMAGHFREFGLSEYVIQEKELTERKIRAALATNIIVSSALAALLLVSSWSVADFYRHPGVGEIMRLQALNFLIVPFGAVTNAYFQRTLTYRPMLIAGLCANLTSFVVAVGGAYAGLSYMSLAWSSLAGLVVTVGVMLWFRPAHFPRWPALDGVREVVDFSKHAMGIYFFGQLGKSAPEAVIGRVLDMASVAFFSRANGLMEIFNRTILRAAVPICLPYFAQAARAGQSTAQGFMKATTLLTGVGWPFFAVVGALAFCAIRLLYGQQWGAAVPLAQILCLAAIVELPYWMTKEVLIAEGRIEHANRLQFVTQGLRVASLTLVFPFGLTGACWGLVGAACAAAVVSQRALRAATKMRFHELARACAPSAIVTAGVAAPAWVAALLVEQTESNYLRYLALAGASTALAWLLLLRLTRHPFWTEIAHIGTSVAAAVRRLGAGTGQN